MTSPFEAPLKTHQVHNLKELITTMQLSPKDQPVLLVGPNKQDQIEWLTALIAHVFKYECNSCILIATPNNCVADTLALGLLQFIPHRNLLRIASNKSISRRRRDRMEIDTLKNITILCNQFADYVLSRCIVLCTTSMAVRAHVAEKHSSPFTHTLIVDCDKSTHTLEFIENIRNLNSIANNKVGSQLWLTSETWPPQKPSNPALIELPKFITYCSFRSDSNVAEPAFLQRQASTDDLDGREMHSNLYLNTEAGFYYPYSMLPYTIPTDMSEGDEIPLGTDYQNYANTHFIQADSEIEPDLHISGITPEEFDELKFALMASSRERNEQEFAQFKSIYNVQPTNPSLDNVESHQELRYPDISENYFNHYPGNGKNDCPTRDLPLLRYEDMQQYLAMHPTNEFINEASKFATTTDRYPRENPQFICGPLPEFPPSPIIDKLTILKYEFNETMTIEEKCMLQRIRTFHGFKGVHDYVAMMQIIIGVEDCFVQNDRSRHDRPNRQAVVTDDNLNNPYFCSITSDSVPAFVMAGDKVLLSVETDSNAGATDSILGEVKAVCESTLDLELSVPMQPNAKYTMHFALNRLNFRLEQFAMQKVDDLQLTPFLFPETHSPRHRYPQQHFKFYNHQLANERQQRQAVEDIVGGHFYPCPYILDGCAGSGKTDIIVESIIQLYHASPYNRVLVCSPSNGVLDEITVRLASWSGDVRADCLRLFASSTENTVDKTSTLYKVSNFSQGGKNSYIYVANLIRRSRIVLSTLAVSGRIALTDLEKSFFTHIFIDECHASGEPMTLVPIVGICSSYGSINARVVLVGDPQQMGPVVKSPWAKRLNYGRSLMARLLQLPIYRQNNRLSSKLCANYRSHNRIVQVASKLFYSHRMTPHACLIKTTTLFPDINFPIKFDNVNGKPSKGTSCDSWYNMAEVHHVISLVIYLVHVNRVRLDDIGIISPYRRQIMKIANQLGAWKQRIKVGSVEQFQGVERQIIIVSTVRTKNLGFVTDPGRINVILTRAISILVVVGNASSLEKQSSEWAKVIGMCRENGTLCQA